MSRLRVGDVGVNVVMLLMGRQWLSAVRGDAMRPEHFSRTVAFIRLQRER